MIYQKLIVVYKDFVEMKSDGCSSSIKFKYELILLSFMYLFSNAIGSFVIDEHFHIKEKVLFSKEEAVKNAYLLSKGEELESEKSLIKKHPHIKKTDSANIINRILENFRKDAKEFYSVNLFNTKKLVSESVKDDLLIIQAVKTTEDIDKIANGLCKRLREWYSLYLPEASELISDNETFVKVILEKDKNKLLHELKVDVSMGKDLRDNDVEKILSLAKAVEGLYAERRKTEDYMEGVMKNICHNFHEITGTNIGAKMIAKAGSVEKMAFMPASTIQLLGAEEALFRHIKTGARSPKYGILLQHPLVMKAKRQDKGKVAKALADKISIAIKVDFFKGEFIGDKLRKDLEKKFS